VAFKTLAHFHNTLREAHKVEDLHDLEPLKDGHSFPGVSATKLERVYQFAVQPAQIEGQSDIDHGCRSSKVAEQMRDQYCKHDIAGTAVGLRGYAGDAAIIEAAFERAIEARKSGGMSLVSWHRVVCSRILSREV